MRRRGERKKRWGEESQGGRPSGIDVFSPFVIENCDQLICELDKKTVCKTNAWYQVIKN